MAQQHGVLSNKHDFRETHVQNASSARYKAEGIHHFPNVRAGCSKGQEATAAADLCSAGCNIH